MKYILFSVLMSGSLSSFAASSFFKAHCTSPSGTIVKISGETGCGSHSVHIYKQTSDKTDLVFKLEGTCNKPFEFVGMVDYQKNILTLTSNQFLMAPEASEQFALIGVSGSIKAKAADEYSRNITFDADFIRKSSGSAYKITVENVTCKAEDFLNHFNTGDWAGNQ